MAVSHLSFGGFGAMVRHLPRLTMGIDEALQTDNLSVNSLAILQPYQPNVSVYSLEGCVTSIYNTTILLVIT